MAFSSLVSAQEFRTPQNFPSPPPAPIQNSDELYSQSQADSYSPSSEQEARFLQQEQLEYDQRLQAQLEQAGRDQGASADFAKKAYQAQQAYLAQLVHDEQQAYQQQARESQAADNQYDVAQAGHDTQPSYHMREPANVHSTYSPPVHATPALRETTSRETSLDRSGLAPPPRRDFNTRRDNFRGGDEARIPERRSGNLSPSAESTYRPGRPALEPPHVEARQQPQGKSPYQQASYQQQIVNPRTSVPPAARFNPQVQAEQNKPTFLVDTEFLGIAPQRVHGPEDPFILSEQANVGLQDRIEHLLTKPRYRLFADRSQPLPQPTDPRVAQANPDPSPKKGYVSPQRSRAARPSSPGVRSKKKKRSFPANSIAERTRHAHSAVAHHQQPAHQVFAAEQSAPAPSIAGRSRHTHSAVAHQQYATHESFVSQTPAPAPSLAGISGPAHSAIAHQHYDYAHEGFRSQRSAPAPYVPERARHVYSDVAHHSPPTQQRFVERPERSAPAPYAPERSKYVYSDVAHHSAPTQQRFAERSERFERSAPTPYVPERSAHVYSDVAHHSAPAQQRFAERSERSVPTPYAPERSEHVYSDVAHHSAPTQQRFAERTSPARYIEERSDIEIRLAHEMEHRIQGGSPVRQAQRVASVAPNQDPFNDTARGYRSQAPAAGSQSRSRVPAKQISVLSGRSRPPRAQEEAEDNLFGFGDQDQAEELPGEDFGVDESIGERTDEELKRIDEELDRRLQELDSELASESESQSEKDDEEESRLKEMADKLEKELAKDQGELGGSVLDDLPEEPEDVVTKPVEKTCEQFRFELLNDSIRDISLDISPPASSIRDQFTTIARNWTDRSGNVIASGAMVDLRRGYVIIDGNGGRQKIPYAKLSEADLGAISEYWRLPKLCSVGDRGSATRSWTPQTYTWKASALCHKSLFFENTQLERYGHSRGPFSQPVHSIAHFFVSLATVPYQTAITPANECQYALGFYRPGNCAPWLKDPIPISLDGARRQVLVAGFGGFTR